MANTPIASGLLKSFHIVSIVETVRQYFADIEPKIVMPYMIDLCPANLLPILAKQFDVLGNKGWNLAKTEEQQRNLIKDAIYLHSIKGTPFALTRAFSALGYPNITIVEGLASAVYDGTYLYNGQIIYGSSITNWAVFSIVVDIALSGLSGVIVANMIDTINIYKPARCLLRSLSAIMTLNEFEMEDDSGLIINIV